MIVQTRDKEILKRIYEHQFLLIDHVAEYFKTKAEAWKRVREMEKAGLVCRESLFTFGAKSAIRVTRIGEEVALNSNAHLTPQAKKIDQGTAEHDAFVASVRQRLEHHWPGGR